MAQRKKSKLEALYPERELQFGELTAFVKAVPGIYAADLVEYLDMARDRVIGRDWSKLRPDVWAKLEPIFSRCVSFDDDEVTLEVLPIKPLGEIIQAVRDLTFESAGDPGNPSALPRAIGTLYGLVWTESATKGTKTLETKAKPTS